MLKESSLKDFVCDLSSDLPAPGGGSVAALCGALAGALTSMVFNLTKGKKDYNEYEEKDKELIKEHFNNTELFKKEFLDFMDKDGQAFLSLMKAFKLPKVTEEEKKLRKEVIQEKYKKAVEVPFKVSNNVYKLYEYIYTACNLGNKNVITDAGIAAILVHTAIESAILNVKINIRGIDDEKYNYQITREYRKLLNNSLRKKNEILNIVNSKL